MRNLLLKCTVSFLLLIFIVDFAHFNFWVIENDEVLKSVLEDRVDSSSIKLSHDWDYIYIFEPYTSAEQISSTIGFKYRNTENYLTYRLFSQNTSMYSDTEKKVLIVKNGKIIMDINFDSSKVDFENNIYVLHKKSHLSITNDGNRKVVTIISQD